MSTRTKLVCTLGPATNTPKFIRGLVTAGATIFRINFSHGQPADHARAVELVRSVEAKGDRALAVMADLPGPKVRLGTLQPDPWKLAPGQAFVLRPDGESRDPGAATTYEGLADDLEVGDRILLADGAVELTVTAIEGSAVRTECVRGGTIRSGQGVNVPAERLRLPAVTDRDREGLTRALDLGRRPGGAVVRPRPRRHQGTAGADGGSCRARSWRRSRRSPPWRTSTKILRVTDVVMVARGDLGVELPMEEIPLLQKDLLRAARAASRPAIVATQMLESMIRAPRPTRAEADRRRERRPGRSRRHHAVGRDGDRPVPVRGRRGGHEDRGGRGVTRRGVPGGAARVPARRRGPGGRPCRRGRRDRGSRRRRDHVLHGDGADGASALGRAPELPGVRVHPGRTSSSRQRRAVGGDPVAGAEAGRHRRDDRADGRGAPGVRARAGPATPSSWPPLRPPGRPPRTC